MISKNKKYSPSFGHDLISKSFESLLQQLKYKLESLLAVYCVGRYQVDISSQCIPNAQTPRGSSTRTYNGQGVYWTGPKSQECPGEWCWLWRAAGLLFHESPADTRVLGSHRTTFCLQPPLPSLFPHWGNSHPPFILPVPLWLQGWSETVNHLSSRGVDRCHLLWPGPQGARDHLGREAAQSGGEYVCV